MSTFFKLLNVLTLVALLLSCMAVFVEPRLFWPLSFIGFAFPIALAANVGFLLLWIFKRDLFGLIPLVAIVLCWKFIEVSFAVNYKASNQESGVKLMSWNVKNFDLYNWSNNKETKNNIMRVIKSENPDMICLQEFYSEQSQHFNTVAYLRDTLHYAYHYFQPTTTIIYTSPERKGKRQKIERNWGLAIFSKYPITHSGRIDFENSRTNDCIYADVKVDSTLLRVYTVHLESIHLGDEDYATLDSLQEQHHTKWQAVKKLIKKMKRAYIKRGIQANIISEHMSLFNGSKILCGDFNDVPVSYTYHTSKGEMQDAFTEKGAGFGATYARRFSPFRIDYTLLSPDITIHSCKVIRQQFSDHYPVVTTFNF